MVTHTGIQFVNAERVTYVDKKASLDTHFDPCDLKGSGVQSRTRIEK